MKLSPGNKFYVAAIIQNAYGKYLDQLMYLQILFFILGSAWYYEFMTTIGLGVQDKLRDYNVVVVGVLLLPIVVFVLVVYFTRIWLIRYLIKKILKSNGITNRHIVLKLCAYCNYDLNGVLGNICPECGQLRAWQFEL